MQQPRTRANATGRPGGWVLVTGASAGIGRELARAFASRGYDLMLAARNEAALAALARELAASSRGPGEDHPGRPQRSRRAGGDGRGARAAGVEVGVLVNNAGVMFEGDFAGIALERPPRGSCRSMSSR